jgi:hypothetical protein
VPAILAFVLARSGQHALERYHIAGVRVLALLAGAVPIVAALFLIASGTVTPEDPLATPHLVPLTRIWAVLLIISWLLACALAVSWLFAAGSEGEQNRDWRWTRFAARAGTFAGLALLAGGLLSASPYRLALSEAHAQSLLMHHAGWRVAAASIMGLASVALYTFVGAVWRIVDETLPRDASWERKAGAIVICGSGILWATSALVALCGSSWFVLTVHTYGSPTLASAADALHTVLRETVWPSAVFVTASSVGLAWKGALKPITAGSIIKSALPIQIAAGAVGGATALLLWLRATMAWSIIGASTLPVILGAWAVLAANLCRYAAGAAEERIA